MSNEISISPESMKLIDNMAEELFESTIENPDIEPSHAYCYAREKLDQHIATLEAENKALKAEAAKYEWKTGHPEHENEVLIKTQWIVEGKVIILNHVDYWNNDKGSWNSFNSDCKTLESFHYRVLWKCTPEVLAYSEIRPWKEGE